MSQATWGHVDYEAGQDPFWDKLGGGDEWGALDGVVPGARVYVTWGEQSSGRLVVTGLCLRSTTDQPIGADALRAVPIGRLEAGPNEGRAREAAHFLEKAPRLYRPTGSDPDGFYRAVAAHYRAHAALSGKPAARMAEAAGVPVTTVHRWVREARLRGHLPPGRQGKAG